MEARDPIQLLAELFSKQLQALSKAMPEQRISANKIIFPFLRSVHYTCIHTYQDFLLFCKFLKDNKTLTLKDKPWEQYNDQLDEYQKPFAKREALLQQQQSLAPPGGRRRDGHRWAEAMAEMNCYKLEKYKKHHLRTFGGGGAKHIPKDPMFQMQKAYTLIEVDGYVKQNVIRYSPQKAPVLQLPLKLYHLAYVALFGNQAISNDEGIPKCEEAVGKGFVLRAVEQTLLAKELIQPLPSQALSP